MRFKPGQLVRLNPEYPHIQDSNQYGDNVARCRHTPLGNPNLGSSWNVIGMDTVGLVIKTELDDEELVGLKHQGYYPLIQEMIVALMGEDLVYIESGMLKDIEEEE